jgi:carbohydrate kinase (thermoresistant glucokinase family)
MVYIMMGVSGCGKTTVGKLLAGVLGVPFYDADDFHPAENTEKMGRGVPLDDNDRLPWLNTLGKHIETWQNTGAVLACSALKQKYREILSGNGTLSIRFIYLKGTAKLILRRMKARKGHYFHSGLLESQFAALEEPCDAVVAGIEEQPQEICTEILNALKVEKR